MKELRVLFLLIVLLKAPLLGQWDILNSGVIPIQRSGDINRIDFIDENIGWLAGNSTLLRSTDGGLTWLEIDMIDEGQLEPMVFINDTTLWGIREYWNESENHYGNELCKSEDQGHNWSAVYQTRDTVLNNIYALDENFVWAIGTHSKIIKSSNGGESWADISLAGWVDLVNIHFVDSLNGVVSGFDDGNGILLRTSNGGKTWQDSTFSEYYDIYGINFFNDSSAFFIFDSNGNNSLCLTNDRFHSWSTLFSLNFRFQSLHVINKDTLFIGGHFPLDGNSTLLKSIDGGKTWESLVSLWSWTIFDISFNCRNSGYMIARKGYNSPFYRGPYSGTVLSKTDDGGLNWNINKFINYPLNDISFVDHNTGILAGGAHGLHFSSGDIFLTSNGGNTWIPAFGNCPRMIKCQFIDDNQGFALAQEDYGGISVHKTINRGEEWRTVYNEDLYDSLGYRFEGKDIVFTDLQNGWIVGSYHEQYPDAGAGILQTQNGGETWDLVWKYPGNEDNDNELQSGHVSSSRVWAVGSGGLVVKSLNTDSFKIINVGTDLPLRDVFFSDQQHGWISGGYLNYQGSQSILLKTIDGGEKWNEILLSGCIINNIYFADSLNGWGVGSDTTYTDNWPPGYGIIIHTTDGGASWIRQVEGLNSPLESIHFKDNIGWAVGENGMLLRTDNWATWIDQRLGKSYPQKHQLLQNYPNPFNPKTNIEYRILNIEHVNLSIYNILGQKVATLVDKKQTAGSYQVQWDASGFASGIYIYQLTAKSQQQNAVLTKKLVLLK